MPRAAASRTSWPRLAVIRRTPDSSYLLVQVCPCRSIRVNEDDVPPGMCINLDEVLAANTVEVRRLSAGSACLGRVGGRDVTGRLRSRTVRVQPPILLQGSRRAARRVPLQRRRIRRQGRRAGARRTPPGASPRPAPARRPPRSAPPLRRDGGPSRRSVPRVGALRPAVAFRRPEHRLQGVHAPAARGGADADPVDHEQPPRGERDPPSADDVRARASPPDAPGESPDLDAGARAPRHRGPG